MFILIGQHSLCSVGCPISIVLRHPLIGLWLCDTCVCCCLSFFKLWLTQNVTNFYRVAGTSVGRQRRISTWDHSRYRTEL